MGLRAVALTPNTAANTSDELSWDRAQARSLAGGTAIYLALNRLDVDWDMEELIERSGQEAGTNSEVSSEEPEFVLTVLCRTMTQKSVRKADTPRTERDSEDQKCFNCVTVRIGDRVINVVVLTDHWRIWTSSK